MTFAWRPGSQYDVAATRGADSVLASDCRAHFGCPSTRKGCCICVTVRLPVRPETRTVGTVFPETGRGTGTVGTVFQKPKPEPSLSGKQH